MNEKQILESIKSILKRLEDIYVATPIDKIVPANKLIDDLGIDSLGRVGLFYELLDEFDMDEDESACQSWVTINDIILFVSKRVNE